MSTATRLAKPGIRASSFELRDSRVPTSVSMRRRGLLMLKYFFGWSTVLEKRALSFSVKDSQKNTTRADGGIWGLYAKRGWRRAVLAFGVFTRPSTPSDQVNSGNQMLFPCRDEGSVGCPTRSLRSGEYEYGVVAPWCRGIVVSWQMGEGYRVKDRLG